MTDKNDPEAPLTTMAPAWATCGDCDFCLRYDDEASWAYDPFFYVTDEKLRKGLRARCGICVEPEGDDPTVVMLGLRAKEMPCGGEAWEMA